MDLIDAQAITKQKIFDVATIIKENNNTKLRNEMVLTIQCGNNHLA